MTSPRCGGKTTRHQFAYLFLEMAVCFNAVGAETVVQLPVFVDFW